MSSRLQFLLIVAAVATTAGASASDAVADESEAAAATASQPLSDVVVHAFASQGAFGTTGNNYLGHSKDTVNLEFSEVGINFTKQVTNELRMGVQLFGSDIGPTGTYRADFDWFYLDYRWRDWLGIRAGRVKVPFGLYNEINDIDAARPTILLPQSGYPLESRDLLLAQTGFEIYGYVTLAAAGALDYRLYAGSMFLRSSALTGGSNSGVSDLHTPYLVGGRILWETPIDGLRTGFSMEALELSANVAANATAKTPASALTLPATLWMGSIEYAAHDLLLAAEYGRWRSQIKTDPQIYPSVPIDSERFYVMGAYRLNRWLQPAAYYAGFYPDVSDRVGRDAWQHDFAGTVRFDINAHWIFKIEGHFIRGTAALRSDLNDNLTRKDMQKDWGMLLAKTTAYF